MTTYFPGILSNGALVPGLAAGTVRDNLGLGGAALLNVGTSAGTVAAGDAASASIATHAGLTSGVHGISAFGATLIDDAAAVDARNTLGLGTADSPTFATLHLSGQTIDLSTANNAGIRIVGQGPSMLFNANGSNQRMGLVGGTNLLMSGLSAIGFVNSANVGITSTLSVGLSRQADHILAQRNGTNAQTGEVYKTYTSATSNERLAFDTTAASFYDIVAARGSAGGAERGIRIGGKLDGGSFVPWLSFWTNGAATFTHQVTATSTGGGQVSFIARGPADLNWGGGIQFVAANGGVYGSIIGVQGRLRQTKTEFTGTITGRASTTAAGTAPIKLPTGVLQTTPQAGSIEYDGTNLYFTDSGGTRRTLAVV